MSWPSWAWKTRSALEIAYGITWDWDKIVIIDTENWSADLYSNLWGYNVYPLKAPFTPESYIKAIKECESAWMEVIIIDSTTHEWDWAGWYIEMSDALWQRKYKGNSWAAKSETKPRHTKFIDAMIHSSAHIIATVRSKTETIQVDWKVKKIWMKDIQADWFEHEFTVFFNIERDEHYATASKDRTNLFIDSDPFIISQDTWRKLLEWNQSWAEPNNSEDNNEDDFDSLANQLMERYEENLKACINLEQLQKVYGLIMKDKLWLWASNYKQLWQLKDDMKASLSDNQN